MDTSTSGLDVVLLAPPASNYYFILSLVSWTPTQQQAQLARDGGGCVWRFILHQMDLSRPSLDVGPDTVTNHLVSPQKRHIQLMPCLLTWFSADIGWQFPGLHRPFAIGPRNLNHRRFLRRNQGLGIATINLEQSRTEAIFVMHAFVTLWISGAARST